MACHELEPLRDESLRHKAGRGPHQGPVPPRCDETALDFFTRMTYPSLSIPTIAPDGLRVGETVEILGEPSTGKTLLMMDCCARCILPSEHGGNGASAIVVDTEGSFGLLRLGIVLDGLLLASGVADETQRKELTFASLRRLRVLQCHNADELVIGLAHLRCECESDIQLPQMSPDAYDLALPRLLLLDSASAFRWLDRAAPRGNGGAVDVGFEARLSELLGLLRKQRLSIIWSRCPLTSHNAGLDFPIVDRMTTGGTMKQPHELSQPTLRVRLRRLESGAPGGGRLMHACQALLDRLSAPAHSAASVGPPSAPVRHEMHVDMQGVVHVAHAGGLGAGA